MKQEPLTITQTFASPESTRQPILQQKVEHYLKSQAQKISSTLSQTDFCNHRTPF